MPHHIGAGVKGDLGAAVNRPIIDNQDLRPSDFQRADIFQKLTQALRFIENRNDD
jgi:hypothetical protein